MTGAEGFAQIPIWMIRDISIPRSALLVYASLSSRAGYGAIFPSQATIAEESGLSERTVRTMLNRLEELGVVERFRRRNEDGHRKTDGYALHPNGRIELPANLAGRPPLPANEGGPTGNEQQWLPLIEIDKEEIDKDSRAREITFDAFWSVWPRKDAKKAAQAAWSKAVKRASVETILQAARNYAQNPHRPEMKFVPHAATWLNGDRWNDPLPGPSSRQMTAVDVGRAARDILVQGQPGLGQVAS